MKVFIIVAMTADGYIAKETNHGAFWTGKADKKRFVELTKKAGVVIMGENTYKTLPRPLKERVNIVYSHNTFDGVETTTKAPAELIKELEGRGFKEVAICGGTTIYTMFMKAKVVDRLFITIEPILFGSGLKLFNDDMLFHLKLVSAQESSDGALLQEYAVDYSGNPKTAQE